MFRPFSWLGKFMYKAGGRGTSVRRRPLLTVEILEDRIVPVQLATAGSAFAAIRDQATQVTVGTFSPESGTTPTDYKATILWGDGRSSVGTVGSDFSVSGANAYNTAGEYVVAFQVTCNLDQTTGVGIAFASVDSPNDDTQLQILFHPA